MGYAIPVGMLAHSLDNLRVLARMFVRLVPGEAGHSFLNTAFSVHGEIGLAVEECCSGLRAASVQL